MLATQSPRVVVEPNSTGQHYELKGQGFAELGNANRFLAAAAARGLAATTVRAYAFDLIVVMRWLAQTDKTVEKLQEADLLDFISAERARKVQACSINRRLTTIQAFYSFVTGNSMPRGKGVSVASPYYKGRGHDRNIGVHRIAPVARRALRVKTPRKLVEPLRPEQVNAFIKTIHRYRDLALFYLMLFCGLRSHEALALTIGNIDDSNNTIVIDGKGGRQRMVQLPAPVCGTLAGYLRCERPRRCLTDRVFVVLHGPRRGCPMTLAGLRSLFRHRRKQRVILHNANPHRLRHTFGADLARAGIGMRTLQQLMGHTDIDTTQRYINLSLEDVAEEYRQASARIRDRYET